MKDDFENLKNELIGRQVERMVEKENSKYGAFIIQANEVQYYLILLILIRSSFPSRKLNEFLERLQFGNLIGCFRLQAKNHYELSLIDSLEEYKNLRNALAHKMYTDKKLTVKECGLSIKLGRILIIELKKLIKEDVARVRNSLKSNLAKK